MTEWRVSIMSDAYQKHFGQLVGCKIVDFFMEKDEDALNDWPVLVVQVPNSKSNFTVQKFNVILSQDEEGNGGGFAFIEETV
jgi:hypothetical protein